MKVEGSIDSKLRLKEALPVVIFKQIGYEKLAKTRKGLVQWYIIIHYPAIVYTSFLSSDVSRHFIVLSISLGYRSVIVVIGITSTKIDVWLV
jgi:hypothetical protein